MFSRLKAYRSSQRASFAGIFSLVVLVLPWLSTVLLRFTDRSPSATNWEARREEVKDAFVESWDAYARHAWGKDVYHPISKSGSQMSPDGLGWIIVDSLDTLMIMNLTSQLADARKWVSRKLHYDQIQDVNTFETTIRMLGGLLSAHYLASVLPESSSRRDYVYLEKAIDLGNRLLGAYASNSGIPYASVDLRTAKGIRSHADGGASSTAEATSVQLEMKYLAHLTGNDIYWRKVEKAMKAVDDNGAQAGLVPIFVDPMSGRFTTREIRLGSQYLVKQYLQTSGAEPIYRDMWEEALAGIQNHLLIQSKDANLNVIAELPRGIGGRLSPKMDHLVCFLPGSIALGATGGLTEEQARKLPSWTSEKAQQMTLARELMKTCYSMYRVTATGLAPEIVHYHASDASLQPRTKDTMTKQAEKSSSDHEAWKRDSIIKPLDAHNLQRPETVESLFFMWRITKDPMYRDWSWDIFKAFQEHTMLPLAQGYTSLQNVKAVPPSKRDNMESFWLAETLKYLYLTFSPDNLLPLTDVVFNTEAHIFPRINMGNFTTGWERKPRP
ncbi:glycoside hydrolase family 47 protein [Saccharata proteae CBS 121410]|uniref:alpha-1,2-Mannosidase n=1 Tax=Saccharata proteae CBS 121410 TaxID=1314787 RepID=A0A9P4HR45_9PEZI|nr:glycoside hydrolase family 47 protein [Saccharata proteae CBS 121410]